MDIRSALPVIVGLGETTVINTKLPAPAANDARFIQLRQERRLPVGIVDHGVRAAIGPNQSVFDDPGLGDGLVPGPRLAIADGH